MRRLWEWTFASARGSTMLGVLVLVVVMTLLGAVLFDLGTIEARLATRTVSDAQAFHCAEAALDATMKDLARTTAIGNLAAGATLTYASFSTLGTGSTLSTTNGSFAPTVVASGAPVVGGIPILTATCSMPSGATRTVQLGLQYPNAIYEFAVVSGDPSARAAGFGNFYLGGTGVPTFNGGSYVGGADAVNGDMYVSGTAALRGAPGLTPCHSSDCDPTNKNPQLTAIGSLANTSTFNPSDPGAYGTTGLNPMPDVSSVIANIRTAVGNQMTGTYNGSTVYNLTKIFATLGTTSEGNVERNLAPPSGCVYGQAAAPGSACQVWQDLLYVGVKRTSNNPGPTDYPSYYFMGLPASPSNQPQNTSFPSIYNKLVNASAELQQMGFTPGSSGTMGNMGPRLNALAGQDTQTFLVASDRSVDRLVDLTVSTAANGQTVTRTKAPIYFIDDGYFRVDDGTNFAYNGVGTIITSKSMILSDNVVYLNGNANPNAPGNLPGSCANANDRTNCGLADVLGLVAQNDIWVGDAGGSGQTAEWISGVMLAGRDFNYFDYTSSSACCQGPANPVTMNGTVMAGRQVSMARDWSKPAQGQDNATCNAAGGGGCRPVQYFPGNSSCGVQGCWKYLTIDTTSGSITYGALIPDTSYPAFQGCEVPTCPAGTRRVTHFQLKVTYEHRLWHNSALVPPGLPSGSSTLPPTIATGTWKDCGAHPACS